MVQYLELDRHKFPSDNMLICQKSKTNSGYLTNICFWENKKNT